VIARSEYEARLHEEAAKVRGVKFLHNGRVPSQGFDCLGLVVWVQRAAGVSDFPDTEKFLPSNWHVHAQSELYLEGVDPHSITLPDMHDLRVGDCVLFRLGVLFPNTGSMRVQHIGLVISTTPDLRFLQCLQGRGVVDSSLRERSWAKCFVQGARSHVLMRYLGEDSGQ
jgi:cell wall-associated NlpC family hydrolase